MIRTRLPLGLVIFDCDGVLIDSEGIASRLVARELTALGWALTAEQAQARFLGMTLTDMIPAIESRTGRALPEGWTDRLARLLVAAMTEEAAPMPGAVALLEATSALGLPWRIASNSSHPEMVAKFSRAGIMAMVAGRVHSAHDVGRGKPAPDVYFAAAAAAGVAPDACLVVEDSVPGVRAAVAAGMECLGFAPAGGSHASALLEAGAMLFRQLEELPERFRQAMGVTV